MGWDVRWVSSSVSSFNYDFHVTIDPVVAPVEYNYKDQARLEAENVAWRDWSGEQPGMSAFARDGDDVFHTYSAYARGSTGCGRCGSGWTVRRWAATKAACHGSVGTTSTTASEIMANSAAGGAGEYNTQIIEEFRANQGRVDAEFLDVLR